MPRIGALLAGNNTFRGDGPHRGTDNEGQPFGGWSGRQVVLTHHITDDPTDPTVTYIDGLHTAVRTASDAAGHTHLNVVNAHTARQCLADGLLDEILVPIPAVAFAFVAPHAEKTDELHRESTPVPAACR
jgi:hypothetical protein